MFKIMVKTDDMTPISRGIENNASPSIYTPGMNRLMI